MQYGTDAGKANHYLIIGPWDHAGTRSPKKELGGLTFNDASVLDLNKLHTEWYDWTMKSGKKPEFLKKRIAYYVMAADEWKYADSLETLANGKLTLYLGSNGTAGDLFHSGWLTKEARAGAASDAWVYDPLDTRPGEAENADEPLFITSQAAVANLYGAGAIYHSESFAAATEISGWVKLTAWIKMDVPDTDFLVTLYEILPNGSSVLLTNTTMRARYRESAREEKLAAIGKPEKYAFENFMFFSRRIAEGSRLRLVVESLNSISAEKNYNSDGVVAKETGKDARTAHIELLHDGEHPSMLELPVVK
jgi:putative CocE/NonD family hydrolase